MVNIQFAVVPVKAVQITKCLKMVTFELDICSFTSLFMMQEWLVEVTSKSMGVVQITCVFLLTQTMRIPAPVAHMLKCMAQNIRNSVSTVMSCLLVFVQMFYSFSFANFNASVLIGTNVLQHNVVVWMKWFFHCDIGDDLKMLLHDDLLALSM